MEPAASTTVQVKKARAPIPRKWSMHYGQDLQSPTHNPLTALTLLTL